MARLTSMLPPEILSKLFREYVPLREKLDMLRELPEFAPYLTDPRCYAQSSKSLGVRVLSAEYLLLLSELRPGWYVSRRSRTHRFRLEIDETTLGFSLRHFFTEGFEGAYAPDSGARTTFRGSIDRIRRHLVDYLAEFERLDADVHVLTYHLKNYGLVTACRRPRRLKTRYGVHFYDGTVLPDVRTGRERAVVNPFRRATTTDRHFTILMTRSEKLVVECKYPRHSYCRCRRRVRTLSPIVYRATETSLEWRGGSLPMVGIQEFELEKSGEHVEARMTYHVEYSFRNTLEVEIVARRNELLRNLFNDE